MTRRIEPYHPETGDTLEPGGFDITCVIGRVVFGVSDDSPQIAAFKLIAEHEAPGTYSFPLMHGGTCVVKVSYLDSPSIDRHESYDRPTPA